MSLQHSASVQKKIVPAPSVPPKKPFEAPKIPTDQTPEEKTAIAVTPDLSPPHHDDFVLRTSVPPKAPIDVHPGAQPTDEDQEDGERLDTGIKHHLLGAAAGSSGEFRLAGIQLLQPAASKSITVPITSPGVIIAAKGPLETVTLVFPKLGKVADGTALFISISQDVSNVKVLNANLAKNSLTQGKVTGGTSILLFYHAKSDKWYKLI